MGTGVDPAVNHAPPPAKQRYRVKQPDPPTTPTPSTTDAKLKIMLESASRKRPADSSTAPNPRAAKRSKTNGASHQTFEDDWSAQIEEEDEDSSSSEPELKNQVDPALQVCRYLLEMFSVPLLRSHATVSLVDRDRLQLYHANRSVILVSSAINFSDGDGKDKFIATIIAFHCLSLEQNGILETRVPRNAGLILKAKFPDTQVVQQGNASARWQRSYFDFSTFFDLSFLYLQPKDPSFFPTCIDVTSKKKTSCNKKICQKAISNAWESINLLT